MPLFPDVAEQDRRRIHVVDRNIEEALDLVGMQIDRQHALHSGRLQHVGDHLGRDRNPCRARPPILAGVAKVRDGRGDAPGGGPLQGIHHHHQFHQIVVGRKQVDCNTKTSWPRTCSRIFAAHLAVGKTPDIGATERNVQALDDIGRQLAVALPVNTIRLS